MLKYLAGSASLWIGFGAVALGADAPAPAPTPVPTKTQLFDLGQVCLLDGPFKTAQDTDAAYLLKLEPDRLLAWFRKEAGLTPKAEVYGGWESLGVAGHTCGHYMSAIAQMYAATGNPEYKRRADYIVSELDACQKALGTGYIGAIPNGQKMFAEVKAGDIRTEDGLNGAWAPWYTIHKEMAGLLDVYHYCHNDEALVVAKGLGDWCGDEIGGLNHDQVQHMLLAEQGGITESLANLYGITREEKYLATAEKFRHDKFFKPLAQNTDMLAGNHANTQIPKFVGYQRVYELTGDAEWDAAAENFWKTVTSKYSWVIGGNSEHELFFSPDKFEDQMTDTVGPESCNSYNMLKLTEHVFQFHPDVPVMDYYERTLYNHILSTLRPHEDGFVYYTTLCPGSYRSYSTDFDSFWCCVDTGMENHGKYGKMIYAHEGADKLLVNLFIASTLDWQDAGLKIEQRTAFPEEQGSTLVFHPAAPKKMEIDVRYPLWVVPGALKLTVNGEAQAINSEPGHYVAINREWKEGDTLRVETPMTLHMEMLPHSTDYVSILYGPLVLAGKLGLQGLTLADFTTVDMVVRKPSNSKETAVIVGPVADILSHIKPVEGEPLTFKSDGLIKPRDVTMVPFYKLHNERYTVYWHVLDSAKWQEQLAIADAAQAELKHLEANTIDDVLPLQQPEVDHKMASEHSGTGVFTGESWRDAGDGWFSYVMHLDDKQPLELVCKYWGSDNGPRVFDILIDGTVIATETLNAKHPGQFYYAAYPIPADVVKGKSSATVKFQAKPHSVAGGVFDCRIVKAGTVASEK
jgi:uncharacterized protein